MVEEHQLYPTLQDTLDIVFIEDGFAFQYDLHTLDGEHFAGVFIDKVFRPGFHHITGQLTTDGLFQVALVHLDFFRQVEERKDILIFLKTNGTKQRGHGQLLLTVDVGIHHVVDVRGKLNPASLERNDARAIQLRAVGVYARSEEHTGRAVQLRHDNTFSTIDDERTVVRHVRNRTQEHTLFHRLKILVVGVTTRKFQFRSERYTIRQSTLQALFDAVTRGVDIVVQKLKCVAIARVRDGEVLGKHLVESVILTQIVRRVELQELAERLQLDIEKIGIRHRIVHRCKIDSVVDYLGHSIVVYFLLRFIRERPKAGISRHWPSGLAVKHSEQ